MAFNFRRVVTGIDHDGRSCVVSDTTLDRIPACQSDPTVIWRTENFPVSNEGTAEAAIPFDIDVFDSSSFFLLFTAEPGKPSAWHATNSIDYVAVLKGRVVLELEAGGVELSAGDLVVDRGVTHSWRAVGEEPAVMLCSVVRANPVGRGSHFGENFDQYLTE